MRKQMKKLAALLLTLAMLFALAAPGLAADAPPPGDAPGGAPGGTPPEGGPGGAPGGPPPEGGPGGPPPGGGPGGGPGGTPEESEPAPALTDVAEDEWYYDVITYVDENGLMDRIGETEFEPDTLASRSVIVTGLYRLESEPDAESAGFPDVEEKDAGAVDWAYANGIIDGYDDGRFGPEDNVTREQLAAIMYRYAAFAGRDVTASADLSGYTDADQISDYAKEAMSWANAEGLIIGRSETTLVPQGTVTRSEAAAILARYALAGQAVKVITRDYAEPENLDLDLTGLYTGEEHAVLDEDKTVAAGETWKVADNCSVKRLEIEEGAAVEADFPVIVLFEESDTVENGQVMGNVQFVCDFDEVVAIVHTNDTHGFLKTEPYVKGLKTQLEQSGDYSLVLAVSAGDLFAGGYAAAHVYEGEYIPYIMADIYDYLTWGNNDGGITDQGLGTYFLSALGNASGVTALLANQNASETIDLAAYAAAYEPAVGAQEFVELYPMLKLNEDGSIDYSALNLDGYRVVAGDNALDDGAVVETANGTKLGLFGESTQGGSITDAYFAGGQSTTGVAQTMSDALREQGASAVVMIAHTGWMGADSTDASSNDTNSAQVALKTTGIDAIIDGHTHSVINDGEGWLFDATESNTIVNQANCKGEAIGVLYLYLKDGQVVAKDCENITPDEDGIYPGITPDAGIQAKVDRCHQRLADDGYSKVYATSEYFLNGERISSGDPGGGVRANETNLGDLVADGILYTAQQLWEGEGAPISIALYPGFWVRASIPAGDITLIDAMSVFANPLVIYYQEYTAAELVALMNTSCSKLGQENNSMFQVAGLTCTYDPETFQVVTLTVGEEKIYDHGEYLVGDDWTVGCAAEKGGGDMTVPDGTLIVGSNSDMARYWCDFLANGEYTIYPDEMCPAGRVVPAE